MNLKITFFTAAMLCFLSYAKDIDLELHVKTYWKAWQGKKVEAASEYKKNPVEAEILAHFKASLMRFAPHIVEESEQIDRIFQWEKGTHLAILCFGAKVTPLTKGNAPSHECTSWAVMENMTDGKSIIMHKNRDSSKKTLTLIRRAVPGKHAWIGNGYQQSFFPTQGINDRGVVVLMNSGEAMPNAENSKCGLGTIAIARILLEECGTAENAISLLKKIIYDNSYSHNESGSIWFIGDKNGVYIVEHSARNAVAKKILSGIAVRANVFDFPEMQMFGTTSYKDRLGNTQRAQTVLDYLLNKAWRPTGIITPLDIAAASRITQIEDAPKVYPPSGKSTISATTFVIDKEFPELLSSSYTVFASPSSSCYLPVPMTLETIPEEILNGSYSEHSFALKEKELPFLPAGELEKLEARLYARHAKAVEEARTLLRTSRKKTAKQDAAALLNAAFEANFKEILAVIKKSGK